MQRRQTFCQRNVELGLGARMHRYTWRLSEHCNKDHYKMEIGLVTIWRCYRLTNVLNHNANSNCLFGDMDEELPSDVRNHAATLLLFEILWMRITLGLLHTIQNARILCWKQNAVETATFGSEFVALRVYKEIIVALRYKLKMFEVPASVFCDNPRHSKP